MFYSIAKRGGRSKGWAYRVWASSFCAVLADKTPVGTVFIASAIPHRFRSLPRTLDAQIGTTALELLTPQPVPPEAVLAVLTNDLASHDAEDFALVLDDYHLITADPIHRGMTYLLEHLPPQMHLLL